jgi:integrase
MEAFLTFKHALGHPYVRAEFTLRAFDRFVAGFERRRGRRGIEPALLAWLAGKSGRKPVTVTVELGVLRQFCLFRRRRDPRAFVPGRMWAPQPTTSDFLPHVFSVAEVRRLLRATARTGRTPFRGRLLRALLLLLYCTGLRFGEALRLRIGDLDLHAAILFVAESKGRSRWVPFHRSLAQDLSRYLVARRTAAPADLRAPLFVGATGRALSAGGASVALRSLFRHEGLKPGKGRVGPRPYDMRHTFAVHRLTRWYRAGVDLNERLPWLAAYMGHQDITGTETYLTATPELLALAAHRFRRRYRLSRRGQ